MIEEDRELDKKTILVPSKESGKSKKAVSLDVIKSAYITEGLTEAQLCERFHLEPKKALQIITEGKLPELKKQYAKQGLIKVQSNQASQAQRLLDLETQFKRLRIVQLEAQLEEYLAHYARHGDLKKRHSETGEILYDTNDMPYLLRIPDVVNEIKDIKESVNVSQGLKDLLVSLNDIIKPQGGEDAPDGEIIDLVDIDGLFKPSSE